MSQPLSVLRGAGFKIIPTLTDGTDIDPTTGSAKPMVLSNLIADPTSQSAIVNTIMNLITSNSFDGIDLDFENFAYVDPISTWPTTEVRWVQFISALSTAMHAQGKILSITTPPLFDPATGKKGYYLYAWSQIASMIDQLHIMAYDYSTTSPGPIGPIGWTTNAITYAISVVPASKVYVGIPGYGRDWVTNVSGTCPSLPVNYLKTVAKGVVSTFVMHDANTLASAYGATPQFNATYGESTFTYQKVYNGTTATGDLTTCTATRTVWYQDQQGFTLRANLVGQYHLGGISEWTFGMEDPTAITAVRTVAESIAPDQILANLSLLNPTFSPTQAVTNGSSLSVGTPLLLAGTFTLADKTPVASLPVHLQFQDSTGAWKNVQDSTTDANGNYSIPILLPSSTTLRIKSDSSWTQAEGDSAPISISLTRVISWPIQSTMRHGASYVVSGTVQPIAAGITVALNNPGGVSAQAGAVLTTTTDSGGNFSFTINNANPGFYTYYVSTPADSSFAMSSTPLVTVLVR